MAAKAKYTTVQGTKVISWSDVWAIMWITRGRAKWAQYLKNLGVPEKAISVVEKKDVASLVLGALIYAGHLPPHPLVPVVPKNKASKKKPLKVYQSDFDANATNDIVLAKEYNGKTVPTRGRECSSEQMPFIAEDFPTF